MKFADIMGNQAVRSALSGMVDSGRIPHAMLFYENDGGGALAMISAFLQYLYCQNPSGGDSCGECPSCRKISKMIHPDVHYIYPVNIGSKSGKKKAEDIISETYITEFRDLAARNPYFLEDQLSDAIGLEGRVGNISISEARSITSKLYLSAVEGGYKAVVLYLPEKMGEACANKLLKIIEEPPMQTLFLMVTHNPDKVMQTIFSRCQSSRILPLAKEEVSQVLIEKFGISQEDAVKCAAQSGGSIGSALWAAGDREDYNNFMDMFSDLLNAIVARDLISALDVADSICSLDSREKQKAFITFAGDCTRKIFLLQQGLGQISGVTAQEQAFFQNMAARLPGKFCSRTLANLDQAAYLLSRNVSQKILFTDLADRMFISI